MAMSLWPHFFGPSCRWVKNELVYCTAPIIWDISKQLSADRVHSKWESDHSDDDMSRNLDNLRGADRQTKSNVFAHLQQTACCRGPDGGRATAWLLATYTHTPACYLLTSPAPRHRHSHVLTAWPQRILHDVFLRTGAAQAGEEFQSSTRIGVNATGDAGDTSPPIVGQPGTNYIISPATSVEFLLSHVIRHGSEPMNTARCFD